MITEALGDLRDIDVREVMTPRVDVAALSIPVSAEDVAKAVRESGHSAFPVVNGNLDEVVGVLYVNDLFRSRRSGKAGILASVTRETAERPGAGAERPGAGAEPGQPGTGWPEGRDATELSPIDISRRVRQAFVIPESRPILAALVEMRRHRRGFAVVVDEYGGVAGVLTVKDLLEPIVGELHDELDPVGDEPEVVRVDASRWLIDGRTNADAVAGQLGIDVPEGDYVTIGGYLLDALGHIPTEGESLRVDGWELTVQEMDKRRIAKVVARLADPGQAGETPAGSGGPGESPRGDDDAPPVPDADEGSDDRGGDRRG